MPRGQFAKDYWNYVREGGKLSMKDYSELKKKVGDTNATTNQTDNA